MAKTYEEVIAAFDIIVKDARTPDLRALYQTMTEYVPHDKKSHFGRYSVVVFRQFIERMRVELQEREKFEHERELVRGTFS